MTAQKLLLDRVEFTTIKVATHVNGATFENDQAFPQLNFDFSKVAFATKSALGYPESEAEDPRYFSLTYGIRAIAEDQNEGIVLPYEIEIEAVGFFRYVGGEEFQGADRFRAVRFSGYQILYGAIREMVSNLTSRGRHGLWHLPSRTFQSIAKERAEQDEKERLEIIENRNKKPVKRITRKQSKKMDSAVKSLSMHGDKNDSE